MKYVPKNTLAYYNAAPQFHLLNLSHLPVSTFGAATDKYRKGCGEVSPDHEALTFYALNHCASIVRKMFTPNEQLPEWALQVMKTYMEVMSGQGKRMLHYIMYITTREMRHLHIDNVKAKFWPTIEAKWGPNMVSFIKGIHDLGEYSAADKYMQEPPEASVGQYMAALTWGFDNGQWSSSYGGKKWGRVAEACERFLFGKTSMETLVDTGYTLAHNGGPIFNKGMMYSQYSGSFVTLLDVQRSGQIPELVLDSQSYGPKKNDTVNTIVSLVNENCPNEFRGWVDWFMVEKLGAVHQYPSYKEKQKKLHPESAMEPEVKNVMDKVLNGKKIKVVGKWQVAPGLALEKFERVQQNV